jgi:hypothetical protein
MQGQSAGSDVPHKDRSGGTVIVPRLLHNLLDLLTDTLVRQCSLDMCVGVVESRFATWASKQGTAGRHPIDRDCGRLTVIVAFFDGLNGHGEGVREGSPLNVFYERQLVLSDEVTRARNVGRREMLGAKQKAKSKAIATTALTITGGPGLGGELSHGPQSGSE